jgi:hypothetical protein
MQQARENVRPGQFNCPGCDSMAPPKGDLGQLECWRHRTGEVATPGLSAWQIRVTPIGYRTFTIRQRFTTHGKRL